MDPKAKDATPDPKAVKQPAEPKCDYSDKKSLDEQIAMAKEALNQLEMEFTARSNHARGVLNALEAIKEGKPIVTRMPGQPQAEPPKKEPPAA